MKLLKKIGLGFLGFLVLLVLVSFLLPSKTHVERSLVIKTPAAPIFDQVNTLKNWEKWSPWHKMDPHMKLTYAGPASGTGAKYSWSSDELDTGSLEIIASTPNQSIGTAMNFGDMGTSYGNYKFETTAEGTKVTWSMDSDGKDLPLRWAIPAKYFNLFMDDMVGSDFEKGLNNLKSIVESQPVTSSID